MQPAHDVQDWSKVEEIKRSLEQNGWVGAPLVVWGGEFLMTGVHRYEAARQLDWQDSEIPTIELSEVFAEAGLDFDALHAEHDYPTYTEIWYSGLLDELPAAIADKYGMEW